MSRNSISFRVQGIAMSVSGALLLMCGTTLANGPARASNEERILRKEVVVEAPVECVWRAWTTTEGIASFFAPNSRIEMQLGGAYELYMGMMKPDESGKRGTEGCK